MSTVFNVPRNISNFKAGADLSAVANLNLSVKFDGSGDIVLSGAGDAGIGFLVNSPKSGEVVEMSALGGGALAVAAGTIAAGDFLKSDANGKLVVASTADDLAVARAMKSAVANDIFEVEPILVRIHA